MLGQQLASRYQIVKKLGLKTDSQTYLSQDIHNGQNAWCVVKQIYPPIQDPDLREQARILVHQEVEKMAQLNSFSLIPKLLNNFEENRAFYLVQEWIEGTSLATELAKNSHYSEEETVNFLRQSLMVLHRIHGVGIIHQDIKPANWIRQSEKNKLMLVDFGRIKPLENQLALTLPVEQLCYVAPEQLRHHPKFASDIYSLGMTAIQAFTGKNPIEFRENEEGKLLWELDYLKNSPLVPILNRMINRDISQRYSSTRDILEALAIQFPPMRQSYHPTEVLTPSQSNAQSSSSAFTVVTPSASGYDTSSVKSPDPSQINLNLKVAETLQQIPSVKNPSNLDLTQPKRFNWVQSTIPKILGLIAGISLVILLGFQYFQWQKQQKITERINQLEALYEQKDYQACLVETDSPETIKIGVSEEKRLDFKGKCLLGSANEQVNKLRYAEGIEIAVSVPRNSPDYDKAQQLIEDWSVNIVEQADQFYQDTKDLEQALEMLKGIPETSPVKKQALDKANEWRTDHHKILDKTHLDLCKEQSVFCSQ